MSAEAATDHERSLQDEMRELLGNLCVSCEHRPALDAAIVEFAAQPSAMVEVVVNESRSVLVPRERVPGTKRYPDPTTTLEALDKSLQEDPCRFVQTGKCAAGTFLVDRALGRK